MWHPKGILSQHSKDAKPYLMIETGVRVKHEGKFQGACKLLYYSCMFIEGERLASISHYEVHINPN